MNVNIDNIEYVYFIGIGGVGMSALARYFHAEGKAVSGYDRIASPIALNLVDEGIDVHYTDDPSLIPSVLLGLDKEKVLIVYTPAVPSDHKELGYFRTNGYDVCKRAKVLGEICKERFTIAVAGTHGKTTVSSIAAHILKTAEHDFAAFLGGISSNYDSNFIFSKTGKHILAEADEYDKSFLNLRPDIALITSVDPDHLDIYGEVGHMQETYLEFLSQVQDNGKVILSKRAAKGLDRTVLNSSSAIYSVENGGDFYAHSVQIENGKYRFSIETPKGAINDVVLGLPGRHNVENAVAAVAIAVFMDVDLDVCRAALSSFRGVKRRFEYQVFTEKLVYIDDYAHHPEELKASIQSARELFPGKHIKGIFQPHLYSRTNDFHIGFAETLSLLDSVVLLEIYPAREKPIEGVSSKMIYDQITLAIKEIIEKDELIEKLDLTDTDVLMTLGAGDIDSLVKPLKNKLHELVGEG